MQPFVGNAIENLQVGVARTLGVGHGSAIFAEIIKAGVHPLTIAGARGNDGLIQRLTGDKAASHAARAWIGGNPVSERSEEHTSELQSLRHLVCRLLLVKKKYDTYIISVG